MDELQLKLCDIQGRLFELSVDKCLPSAAFIKDWRYYTGESSAKILRQAPAATMKRNYMMFHTMDPVIAIEDLKEIHNQKRVDQ